MYLKLFTRDLQYCFQVSSLKPKLKKSVISTPGNLHGLSSNVSIFISSIVLEGRKNAGFFIKTLWNILKCKFKEIIKGLLLNQLFKWGFEKNGRHHQR